MHGMVINALQYVRNTGGGASQYNFMEDWEPIGPLLWRDCLGLIKEDSEGKLYLTDKGKSILEANENP